MSGDHCPWCGSSIEYFSDDDNSNYNEYICENYNKVDPFTKIRCWWRESSGVKAVTYDQWKKKEAKIVEVRNKAHAMIREGNQILDGLERGQLPS